MSTWPHPVDTAGNAWTYTTDALLHPIENWDKLSNFKFVIAPYELITKPIQARVENIGRYYLGNGGKEASYNAGVESGKLAIDAGSLFIGVGEVGGLRAGTVGAEKAASAAERIGLESAETAANAAKADRMAAEVSIATDSSPKITITGTEPVHSLANGGVPYLSTKPARLAQKPSANAVDGFSSGISFNIKIPQHMSKVETMDRRGIVGGHNMVEFENFAKNNNVLIVGKTKILEGVYEFEYQAPSLDRALNFTGEYKSPKLKTVYDPKVYSNEDMLLMGQAAADKGYKDAIKTGKRVYDSSHEGVSFRVYIDKKYEHNMIDNFFPNKDLYK